MAPRVSVAPPAGPVAALTVATCEVLVGNPGPDADEYRFEVLGEAGRWSWFSPITLEVPAGAEATAKACFRPPRAPSPAAGPYPVAVKVTSVSDPTVATVATSALEIAPFTDLFATIDPRQSQGTRGEHVVCVENRGNSPMATRLRVADAGDAVTVEIEPPSVVAAPGSTATAAVTVRPTRRLRRGGDPVHRFQVTAEAGAGPALRLAGSFRQDDVRSRRQAALVGLLVIALVAGAVLLRGVFSSAGDGADSPDVASTRITPVDAACPAAGHLNRDRRATGELPFSYSFLYADADGCVPWRFDPCRPVHYVTNATLASPGAVDDLEEALARISRASGLEFVHDGPTDERWAARRAPYQPDRYGDRWAPILVSWSSLGNQALEGGRDDVIVAGRGNPVPVDGVLVTGQLDLNVDARTDQARTRPLENGFGEGITWGRVMLHELGHVFGLGHVQSPSNLMHEELTEHTLRNAEFGIGDLQAFRVIGREAGCVPVPVPRPVTPDSGQPTAPPTIRVPG